MLARVINISIIVVLLAWTPATAVQDGDANLDGLVDLKDATILKDNFGSGTANGWGEGDFDLDGDVDLGDFSILSSNLGLGVDQPGTGSPALSLTLLIDVTTGKAWLRNDTGSSAFTFDGYEIWSVGGLLEPVSWESIADAAMSSPADVINTLGAGAMSFGEMTAGLSLLAELDLPNYATLQSGATWDIGKPAPDASLADLSFFYSNPDDVGIKYQGGIEIIPEPTTVGLLLVGGLALLRRKR